MRQITGSKRGAGFTLVELMIVVAIIGILAAIAIPAFSRYVKKSRTAEASGHLNKMWSGAVAYYEADHANSSGTMQAKQFPGVSGAPPQEGPCCGQAGDKCPGSSSVYDNGVWVALNFNVPDPHHFRPSFAASGSGTAARFTAGANGDLDCDTTLSTFQRQGLVNASSGDVASVGATFVDREIE